MTGLSEEQIRRRLPLWTALTNLFLDTEMTDFHYRPIIETARAGGWSTQDVRRILLDEVTPAFAFNLMDVAGEWCGFDPTWVESWMREQATGRASPIRGALGSLVGVRRHIEKVEWPRLERMLAGEDISRVVAATPAKPPRRSRPLLGAAVLIAVIVLAFVGAEVWL